MTKLEDYLLKNGFKKDMIHAHYVPINGERYSTNLNKGCPLCNSERYTGG